MLKRFCVAGVLSIVASGAFALAAKADTAVVQTGTQDLYVNGNGNTAVQDSTQVSAVKRTNVRGGDTGIVQDNYQVGTVDGNRNRTYQGSSQVNATEETGQPNLKHMYRGR
jgi:hypothetical protein